MNRTIRQILLLLTLCLLTGGTITAQRISFGLYATGDIVITPLNIGELNFNAKQPVILAGQTVTINKLDDGVAVLSISARRDLDITVTIDAPRFLIFDTHQIPLLVRFAYSNTGASSEATAKTTSLEVPAGFSSVTFPVLRRASGLPAPPPTPNHTGYVAPSGTAYLFIYGTLGKVPVDAAAGLYTGDINIRVEYTNNTPAN